MLNSAEKFYNLGTRYHTIYAENNKLALYNNTPIQYSATFNGCKSDNFQMKYENV